MAIKYVDAHTHPIKEYYEDNDSVIEKAYKKGVSLMFVTGCDLQENEEVKKIASKYSFTYPVIGVHPNNSTGVNDAIELEKQIDKNVVGIGEIGLDYYYQETNKTVQKESFIAQIEVAQKYNLPVVIHMRDSYEDLYEIMQQYPKVKFMIHTYSGTVEWAKKFLELGCYFSFSGTITYKNSQHLIDVLDFLPIEKILSETDAPYLSPANKRGDQNYSNYVIFTTTFMAGIKKMPIEKFAKQIYKNAKEFFNIKES